MDRQRAYNIDFPLLAVLLTPSALRKPGFAGLLGVLVSVFSGLHYRLLNFRDEALLRLKYNGQVCRLEYCLNRIFNPEGQERITVTDSPETSAQVFYIYKSNTDNISFIPSVIYPFNVNAERQTDFYVTVPRSVPMDDVKTRCMAAVINSYKAPGTSWAFKH